ncbi:MAG: 4Fe-4S dicluster domain-containing protein [Planctomycetes bacterium]|nr:4Fe-4S dicluster domain-containing protein [Planctomycetota bacterium]
MKKSFLRCIRLLFGAAVLIIFFLLLYRAGAGAVSSLKYGLATQAGVNFSSWAVPVFFLFLLLLILAASGRLYCSLFCPAGWLQELFYRLGRFAKTTRLRHSSGVPPAAILLPVVAAIVLGWMWLANFLEPIGLFGRTVQPLAQAIRWLLDGWGDAGVADLSAWIAVGGGVILLVAVPLFKGRLFCDRLCPVGAFLSVCSKMDRRAVAIDQKACVSCGKCEAVCPTGCASAKEKRIESARCVVCLECFAACNFGAIRYTRKSGAQTIPSAQPVAPQRRTFVSSALTAAAAVLYLAVRRFRPFLSGDAAAGILPPGAEPAAEHLAQCVSCQSCVASCPVGIIRTSGSDLRPTLNYDYGYCQYNCLACVDSCPAGVIHPVTLEQKQRLRLAKTDLLINNCVVVTQGTECGACAEVCPTHAVRMVHGDAGEPTLPDFDSTYCIGCGACYHVCPALPRAFAITPLPRQEMAAGVRPGAADEDSLYRGA